MSNATLLQELSSSTIARAIDRKVMIATAESCTGGMIAAALTDIAGSSAVVDRGFVTYSNEAKNEMLGVPMALIEKHGAVSEEVARAMAQGAVVHSRAALAVSVTGIAGPSGGTSEKPVGLVWFGLADGHAIVCAECKIFADASRAEVRAQTVETALSMLLEYLERT